MSEIALFAVIFDLSTKIVSRTISTDIPSEYELRKHLRSGEGIILIPKHRIDDMAAILASLGITET